MADALDITFDPVLSWWWCGAIALVAVILLGWAARVRASGLVWRTAAILVFLLTLANPTLVREHREPRPDVAVIVVDDSASQSIAERARNRDSFLEELRGRMEGLPQLEVRVARSDDPRRRGTRLFDTVSRATGDIPAHRLAGVIAITDGQIHDVNAAFDGSAAPAPFHVILTGRRGESDRRVVIEQAPTFGMVGRDVSLKYRVDESGQDPGGIVPVTVRVDGEPVTTIGVPANTLQTLEVPLTRAGETIVEIQAAERQGELSTINNTAAHAVTAVRDRLRVLLVSGAPHPGERTWRALLKSDPAVDLVHFTVLRPPEKQDGTPTRELSLIAFPVRELFELKIDGFDLIVFDRYFRRGLLPRSYLGNIADYVRGGGALLEASGPSFAGSFSLARTQVGEILPVVPTGDIVTAGFRPRITELGFRHPVTAGLPGSGTMDADGTRLSEAGWGRWLRQIDADPVRGDVLAEGAGNRPLLVLDRVGEGRIAHLLSDHIWLWSRGYEGGGPQAELLRRLAHWLMKEPDLEENDLRAVVAGKRIEVTRRSLTDAPASVTMIGPDGEEETRELVRSGMGMHTAVFESGRIGLHRFSDGKLVRLVALGSLNDVEFSSLRTTAEVVGPVVKQSGGGVFWSAEDGVPDIRRVRPGRAATGRNWLGLRRNQAHEVTGVHTTRMMPELLTLVLLLGFAVQAWRREAD